MYKVNNEYYGKSNESKDDIKHYGVLGMKWGIHRAKVYQRKADKARARGEIKRANSYEARAGMTKRYHQYLGGKKTYDKINKTSTGKLVAESLLMGTYGSLKYNQARVDGQTIVDSLIRGTGYNSLNNLSFHTVGTFEPRISAENKRTSRY